MQHFQFILIILGILAILAVLIHGYFVSRKDKLSVVDESTAEDEQSLTKESENNEEDIFSSIPNINTSNEEDSLDNDDFLVSSPEYSHEEINFSADLSYTPANEEQIVKPIMLDDEAPIIDETVHILAENAPESEANKQHPEPEYDLPVDNKVSEKIEPAVSKPTHQTSTKQDYFVFNVAAKEGASVRGHELLQFFLTAGFRFGEMSIFHRHENSDGTGPILFSIANMMKPGIFDLDEMEQFSSEGVSFFLTVPNDKINVKKAFDMMLVAVEQMAEEFDCVVLNENRLPLTKKEFISYHERLLRYI